MRGSRLRAKVDRRADHFFNHQRIPNQQLIRNAQNVDPAFEDNAFGNRRTRPCPPSSGVAHLARSRFSVAHIEIDDVASDRNLSRNFTPAKRRLRNQHHMRPSARRVGSRRIARACSFIRGEIFGTSKQYLGTPSSTRCCDSRNPLIRLRHLLPAKSAGEKGSQGESQRYR